MENRLSFDGVTPGDQIVVRLLISKGKHDQVREYCGTVQGVREDGSNSLRLKTLHAAPASWRPLATVRELELKLYFGSDSMIHVYGDPDRVYGYALPATEEFIRRGLPPVDVRVDRLRPIGRLAA